MAKPICPVLLKVYLIVINVLFILCGLGILALGIYIHYNDTATQYAYIIHDSADDGCQGCSKAVILLKTPYILMGLGGFITLLSFLGGFGAFAESSCFLWLYSALLILVLAAEIVTAILVPVKKNVVSKCLECTMRHQIQTTYNNTNFEHKLDYQKLDHNKTTLITKAWDAMQVEFRCCGSRGPKDYFGSAWQNQTIDRGFEKQVPPTCCVLSNTNSEYPKPVSPVTCQIDAKRYPDPSVSESLHTSGCHDALTRWLDTQVKSNKLIAIFSLVGILLFQVFACLASCLLLGFYRSEAEKNNRYDAEEEELASFSNDSKTHR